VEVFYFYKIKKNYTHTILKNFETGLITKQVLEKIHNHQKSSRSSSNNPAYDAKGNDTAVKTRQSKFRCEHLHIPGSQQGHVF
jgi:hypothetical protein